MTTFYRRLRVQEDSCLIERTVSQRRNRVTETERFDGVALLPSNRLASPAFRQDYLAHLKATSPAMSKVTVPRVAPSMRCIGIVSFDTVVMTSVFHGAR